MMDLPDSWTSAALKEIADVVMGQSPDSSTYNESGKGVPFFQGKAEFGKKYPTVRKWCSDPKKMAMASDILLSIRAPVGPTNLALEEAAIGRGLAAIRALEGVDQNYLFHFFRCIEPWLGKQGTGTTFAAISGDFIREIDVPVAPESEQKRIADKLDSLLARVDATRARLDRIPELLKRFRQSVLAAATSGQLTEDWRQEQQAKASAQPVAPVHHGSDSDLPPHKEMTDTLATFTSPVVIGNIDTFDWNLDWKWTPLISLAKLESGHTPRKSISEYWDGGDVPWISLQDIREAHGKVIKDTKFHPTMMGIDNSSARLLPEGTVCFSRDISVGFTTIMGRSMATTQHFANWVCGPRLNNRFLMYALMAAKDHLTRSGQGSTVKTIYMPALEQFQILLPSVGEQVEIVRRVELLFGLVEKLEARYQAARTQADNLAPALLAKAFRGELVPQDPNDEPAEQLIARLREVRDTAPATARRGRKKT